MVRRLRHHAGVAAAILSCALTVACAPDELRTDEGGAGVAADGDARTATPATIAEVYETTRDTLDNIDSPAVWHGPAGQHWLLSTAKESDVVVVTDAATGAVLHRFGGEGTEPGRLDRPNGIAVIADLAFVVERDNARVQVFGLPRFEPLGIYGTGDLRRPYGIAVAADGNDVYSTFITDNYEFEEDVIPPDSLLGERLRHYRVSLGGGQQSLAAGDRAGIRATLVNTFGDTSGPGVLRVVESVAVDPSGRLLLIAEEQEGASMIKVYDFDGRFTGRIIDSTFFPSQAEGIVLYDCPAGAGYWITTDQSQTANAFHVFDRGTLELVGSFGGRTVRNTDGVALTQVPFDRFTAGAFFAVHDDGNVAAFRWEDIARPLGLRADCITPVSAR
jgi:3-phytase